MYMKWKRIVSKDEICSNMSTESMIGG